MEMLGRYDNFPENIHRIDSFTFSLPVRKIQEKIIQTFCDMNGKTVSAAEIDQKALRDCTIVFETGVAESGSFNYLNEGEASKLLKTIKKETMGVIDFFLATCYYRNKGEKKSQLKFDYFLMRTVFLEKSLEMRIFHERGPRYISPEDVGNFLIGRINKSSSRRILKNV